MAKFHVVYFGSNEVPVHLIKPILAEIDADMTIRRPTSDADVVEMAKDADGIIMHGSVPLSREIISQLKRVKVVCRTGVGVDRMDLKAAKDHGMIICNAAGCNSIEVAEQAIGLLIAISRKLVRMNQYVHDGKWRRHTAELHAYRGRVYRIQGRTMGIVGLGHVGKQVAPRAQGMRLNVQTFDPYLDPKIAEKMDVKMVPLDELIATSDFISLHAPLTKQTRNMFSTPQFKAMKNTAYLINCARGGLVDSDALFDALVRRRTRRRSPRRHRARTTAGGSQTPHFAERHRHLSHRCELRRILRRLPNPRRPGSGQCTKRQRPDNRDQRPVVAGRSAG